MVARSRASIDGRLGALETARDRLSDQVLDRYFDRRDAILGPERAACADAAIEAGQGMPAAYVQLLAADADLVQLGALYGRLHQWKAYVEQTQTRESRSGR